MNTITKILIKNKKLFSGMILIVALTISLIYGIVFMACGQLSKVKVLSSNIENNSLYVMKGTLKENDI